MVGFGFDIRFLSFILLALLFGTNMVGLKYVTRLGTILLALLFLSILCMYIGIFTAESRSDDLPSDITGLDDSNLNDNFDTHYSDDTSF